MDDGVRRVPAQSHLQPLPRCDVSNHAPARPLARGPAVGHERISEFHWRADRAAVYPVQPALQLSPSG